MKQMQAKTKRIGTGRSLGQKKSVFFLIYLVCIVFSLHAHTAASSGASQPTRVIRDKMGRQVVIPDLPQRIACIHGPSYEKIFAFGAAERVAIVANVQPSWNYVLNPDLSKIPVVGNFTAPDVEQLLRLKTDLVIYPPFLKQMEALTASGLPVVVPYDSNRRPSTLSGFFRDYYEQIRFYGELLGRESESIAEEYCIYMNKRVQRVIAATSGLAPADRPKVFYFCGQVGGPAGTQTRYSTAYWLVEAAGGTMLTHDDQSYFVSVTSEQMILWNPDIIVVSTLPSIEPVMSNPHWRDIKAVKNRKVFMSPEGAFYWSHFSTESFLCIMFLAKLFHPQIFTGVDIREEIKSYYAKFYHYVLTDDEAARIMNHLPPKKTPRP